MRLKDTYAHEHIASTTYIHAYKYVCVYVKGLLTNDRTTKRTRITGVSHNINKNIIYHGCINLFITNNIAYICIHTYASLFIDTCICIFMYIYMHSPYLHFRLNVRKIIFFFNYFVIIGLSIQGFN